jgi:hypothetical protein
MTQTPWADFPNAKHINWVLASLKACPEKWDMAYDKTIPVNSRRRVNGRNLARQIVHNSSRFTEVECASKAIMNISDAYPKGMAWNAAWEPILALTAYDDCAYMIESAVGELRLIAAFGDTKAMLLLPACIVFNETKGT